MSTKVSPLVNPVLDISKNTGGAVGPTTKLIENSRGLKLHSCYWKPDTEEVRALVFISHGFSEHLQWYEELALKLSSIGILAFGHDHVGHGRSEGIRAHITTVSEYTKDILNHCDSVRREHKGKKLFIVGHSMGGMIAIRSAITSPSTFDGMVLIGPLIKANPDEATPFKLSLAKVISAFIPLMPVANLNQSHVTRDDHMKKKMSKDPLRYHGGIRARWAMACHEELFLLNESINDFSCPFLLLHGENDKICSPEASTCFYKNAKSSDKKLKIFQNAFHHLYLELPEIRNEALQDTIEWIQSRID